MGCFNKLFHMIRCDLELFENFGTIWYNILVWNIQSEIMVKQQNSRQVNAWREIWLRGKRLKTKWVLGKSKPRNHRTRSVYTMPTRRSRRRKSASNTPGVFGQACVWCKAPSYTPGACYMKQYLEKRKGNHNQWRRLPRWFWIRRGDPRRYLLSEIKLEYAIRFTDWWVGYSLHQKWLHFVE